MTTFNDRKWRRANTRRLQKANTILQKTAQSEYMMITESEYISEKRRRNYRDYSSGFRAENTSGGPQSGARYQDRSRIEGPAQIPGTLS